MIGIICAEPKEIEMILKDFVVSETKRISGRDFNIGTLYGKECVLVLALIGKVAASITATVLIDRFNVDKVIFAGAAGGAGTTVSVGDIVIGDRLVQHDMNSVFNPLFMIPLLGKIYFEASQDFVSLGVDAANEFVREEFGSVIADQHKKHFNITNPQVVVGTIASGDQFIADPQKNKWLCDNIDNLKCCEMEGAAVAHVCNDFEVPFLCIRVISDSANSEATFSYDEFTKHIVGEYTRGVVKKLVEKL